MFTWKLFLVAIIMYACIHTVSSRYAMNTTCLKHCGTTGIGKRFSGFVLRKFQVLQNTHPFEHCGLATILRNPFKGRTNTETFAVSTTATATITNADDMVLAMCNPNGLSRSVSQVLDMRHAWKSMLSINRAVPWDLPESIGEPELVSADARLFEFDSEVFIIYYRRHPALQLTRIRVDPDTLEMVAIANSTVHLKHRFRRRNHPEKNWGPFEYRVRQNHHEQQQRRADSSNNSEKSNSNRNNNDNSNATTTALLSLSLSPQLLFVYSINPHVIVGFDPADTSMAVHTANVTAKLQVRRDAYPLHCTLLVPPTDLMSHWRWGPLRGGTPAVYIPSVGQYLSFVHSKAKPHDPDPVSGVIYTYFMGAYLFQAEPPFAITALSEDPIIAPGFYTGKHAFPKLDYVNYPMSFIVVDGVNNNNSEQGTDNRHRNSRNSNSNNNYYGHDDNKRRTKVLLSYGRQDIESWIVEMDLERLLQSLKPVTTQIIPCDDRFPDQQQ